jgi:hypothetical protein
MTSKTRTLIIGVTLYLTGLSLSCASLRGLSPPALENRSLRFSADAPALEYQWEECVKRFLGICTKYGMKRDVYDLTKPEVRRMIIDKGFVARVRERR